MAGENRTTDHPLIARLEKEATSFSFFQAVQLLQRAVPGAPLVGHQGPVDREPIRFQPELDLGFAPSDLKAVKRTENAAGVPRYVVSTTFLSLYGANSPLPTYFTEQLLEQEEGSLQREFIDLFHHRILSLFFRMWEKYRYSAQYSEDGKDPISHRLLDLLIGDPARLPKDHHVRAVRLLALG
ncbi:MAG: type VI secretion system baseplate subunit TssG, partial [Acidobacteria bacterium]|nr:type VI secretion system baseplate subunit TssG [Acidobacteriota bacterium]